MIVSIYTFPLFQLRHTTWLIVFTTVLYTFSLYTLFSIQHKINDSVVL